MSTISRVPPVANAPVPGARVAKKPSTVPGVPCSACQPETAAPFVATATLGPVASRNGDAR